MPASAYVDLLIPARFTSETNRRLQQQHCTRIKKLHGSLPTMPKPGPTLNWCEVSLERKHKARDKLQLAESNPQAATLQHQALIASGRVCSGHSAAGPKSKADRNRLMILL